MHYINSVKYVFSIDGHSSIHRRFFVHHNYGGCPGDWGWFVNVDTASPACAWEQQFTNAGPWPFFLYNANETVINYLIPPQDLEQADFIAIYTKPATNIVAAPCCKLPCCFKKGVNISIPLVWWKHVIVDLCSSSITRFKIQVSTSQMNKLNSLWLRDRQA